MIRCMGGARCNHAAGTCTATKGDVPIMPGAVGVAVEAMQAGFVPSINEDIY